MNTFYKMGMNAADENRPRAVDLDTEFTARFAESDDVQARDDAAKEFYNGYDALILSLVMAAVEKANQKKIQS